MLLFELPKCPIPELTDPLPSNAQHTTDLLQGAGIPIVQPEIEPEDLGISGRERCQGDLQLAGSSAGQESGIGALLSQRDKPLKATTILPLPNGVVEPESLDVQS